MKKLKATRTVYCYYFPKVRRLIDQLTRKFPHETFLRSINPGLDDFHIPVIKKYIRFHSKTLPNLGNFKYKYFTNGSSEGIFHLLVHLKMEDPNIVIYVLNGEYEGYKNYAKVLGLNFFEVELEKIETLKKGVWLISNPSARNGNIIPNDITKKICRAGHKVVIDCSYVGLTKPNHFDIIHPNIIAVICSMSKPFGLFYYRIGFIFSKEKIESLEGNIWFKNIFSLLIADNILSKFESDYFYKKYRLIQKRIVEEINNDLNLKMKLSDVIILGYIDSKNLPENVKTIESFKRGEYYRFCLTPYFLEKEGCLK